MRCCSRCGKEAKRQRKYCPSCWQDVRKEKAESRKSLAYKYTKNARKQLKVIAVEYLGGKCIRCGYNKSYRALVFHHRNPTEKDFSISTMSRYTISIEELYKELDKCDLVCANCHAEIHEELES